MIRNRSIPRLVERYDPSRGRTFSEIVYDTIEYGSTETHPLHVQAPPAPYIFPGIWPFIERAATALGCDLHQFGRAKTLWHVTQMQNALGQIAKLDDKSRLECLAHINNNRMSLACALVGVDNAILDACVKLGIPLPDYLKEQTDGTIHACGADDCDVGHDLGTAQDGGAEDPPRQPGNRQHGKGKS